MRAVGEGGVLPVPQEAWEGLDPEGKRLVYDLALSGNVTVVTGHEAGGELRVAVWQPQTQEVA